MKSENIGTGNGPWLNRRAETQAWTFIRLTRWLIVLTILLLLLAAREIFFAI